MEVVTIIAITYCEVPWRHAHITQSVNVRKVKQRKRVTEEEDSMTNVADQFTEEQIQEMKEAFNMFDRNRFVDVKMKTT